jgi:predicted amidohydrolase
MEAEELTISFIQSSIFFEDITANLSMFEEKIWMIKSPVDLIILPEMFNTGFSMNANLIAEPMNGKTMKWMKQIASQKKAVICGSLAIKESGKFYNRFIWMQPDGKALFYDKVHTFTYSGESEIYTKGSQKLIISYKGWKICPLICYDLRFPELSRNNITDSIDLLIYVANWPSIRDYAWHNTLKTRAIENSCYSIGVNRLGIDGNGLEYIGNSLICSPVQALLEAHSKEDFFIFKLDKIWLNTYQIKFPFLADIQLPSNKV